MAGLTNTQAAFRFYNDRAMALLHQRAQSLWVNDYRVTPLEDDLETAAPPTKFLVYKEDQDDLPTDEQSAYAVDPIADTCTCPFFTKQATEPLTEDGEPVPCKHLLGLSALVGEEIAYWQMKADHTADVRREIGYVRIIRALTETRRRVGK